jgi:pimeloyl-ACP methyl ester carboxylesterase
VLLHGLTGHARTWDEEARALGASFRVLALDQRGHGDSDPAPDGDYSVPAMAADLAAFLDALGLARVSLVGLSLGGRVGFAFAARWPDRVERLMVIDIGPDISPEGRQRVGAMLARAPERFAAPEEALAFVRLGSPRYDEARLARRVALGLRPLPGGGYTWKYDVALRDSARRGRLSDATDLWPLWAAVRCPTLVVRGSESDVLSPDIARRMLEMVPQARLVDVEGAGHTVPGDRPQEFLALLQHFLAG